MSLTAREHKQTAETTIIIVRRRTWCPLCMRVNNLMIISGRYWFWLGRFTFVLFVFGSNPSFYYLIRMTNCLSASLNCNSIMTRQVGSIKAKLFIACSEKRTLYYNYQPHGLQYQIMNHMKLRKLLEINLAYSFGAYRDTALYCFCYNKQTKDVRVL